MIFDWFKRKKEIEETRLKINEKLQKDKETVKMDFLAFLKEV